MWVDQQSIAQDIASLRGYIANSGHFWHQYATFDKSIPPPPGKWTGRVKAQEMRADRKQWCEKEEASRQAAEYGQSIALVTLERIEQAVQSVRAEVTQANQDKTRAETAANDADSRLHVALAEMGGLHKDLEEAQQEVLRLREQVNENGIQPE